jgi:2-polyprenyl-3-methyl-5-hydroxy-6-metoxy-1,4-benzoquinol methylase
VFFGSFLIQEVISVSQTSYDDIADWYDAYLRENPMYHEMILPSLFELLGDIQQQSICDLACGQGWVARELARLGAQVTGVDLSDRLLALARQYEQQEPLGIRYVQDDAQRGSLLPDRCFDGCVCVLALMDIADLLAVFHTIHRLLKPGGWFIFAITHPCFEPSHAQWITTTEGSIMRAVGGYFKEGFWLSPPSGGVRSRVGTYHRTMSTYLNALVAATFALERMRESVATGERARQVPGNQEVPSFVLIRARAASGV